MFDKCVLTKTSRIHVLINRGEELVSCQNLSLILWNNSIKYVQNNSKLKYCTGDRRCEIQRIFVCGYR